MAKRLLIVVLGIFVLVVGGGIAAVSYAQASGFLYVLDDWTIEGNNLCYLVREERGYVPLAKRLDWEHSGWTVLDGAPSATQVFLSKTGNQERASFVDGAKAIACLEAVGGYRTKVVDISTGNLLYSITLSATEQHTLGYPNMLKTRSGRYGLTDKDDLTVLDLTTGKPAAEGNKLVALLRANRRLFTEDCERFFITDDLRYAVYVPFDRTAPNLRSTKAIIADASNGMVSTFAVTTPTQAAVHGAESVRGTLWLACGDAMQPTFVTDSAQSQRYALPSVGIGGGWRWDAQNGRAVLAGMFGAETPIGFSANLILADYKTSTSTKLTADPKAVMAAIYRARR
jgi:hypothetical protein